MKHLRPQGRMPALAQCADCFDYSIEKQTMGPYTVIGVHVTGGIAGMDNFYALAVIKAP